MFIQKIGFDLYDKYPRHETQGSGSEIWRKLFSRRHTNHAESALTLNEAGDGLDTSYGNVAASSADNSLIARLLPNLRCSP